MDNRIKDYTKSPNQKKEVGTAERKKMGRRETKAVSSVPSRRCKEFRLKWEKKRGMGWEKNHQEGRQQLRAHKGKVLVENDQKGGNKARKNDIRKK